MFTQIKWIQRQQNLMSYCMFFITKKDQKVKIRRAKIDFDARQVHECLLGT